jgi:hypothetical protein
MTCPRHAQTVVRESVIERVRPVGIRLVDVRDRDGGHDRGIVCEFDSGEQAERVGGLVEVWRTEPFDPLIGDMGIPASVLSAIKLPLISEAGGSPTCVILERDMKITKG